LLYVSLTGDTTFYANAVRELNWASYAVDTDGKNCYPTDEPWLTDGYGDYIRHYLRAMASFPLLAPDEDHILSTTSVVQQADYRGRLKKYLSVAFDKPDTNSVLLFYRTFDSSGTEEIRMHARPSAVLLNGEGLGPTGDGQGYSWSPLQKGGVLVVRRQRGNRVVVVE